MTSSTGRPNSPPLALTSSRQMSSAVLITLLGAAPAPVSARLNPILMGLPLCANAPESGNRATTNAATSARSAFPNTFAIVSSLQATRRCEPLLLYLLLVHFLGRHDAPVVRCRWILL